MASAIIAVAAGLALAGLAGWLATRRSGVLRVASTPDAETGAGTIAGLAADGPTVVHFSAPWCGPCDRVRRVVDQVCGDLGVAHVEVDIDANPVAARRLSVLSLPTTVVFGADGRQLYRATGVPKAAALRSALEPLLA